MRLYNQQHRSYCGVDLHARTLSVCILGTDGTAVYHDTIAAAPQAFLKAVPPFRVLLLRGLAWAAREPVDRFKVSDRLAAPTTAG
jgi:hypothetical protein